ncbi:CHAD domain-containing protein [Pandoraea fibrosis]|uniref:CHAD domain-containing protein n=1 Tax=Pandoraea fibrosis TaxID=1891094 RepID=A0A5E4SEI6_9BURK|nr:CHAD domain-containing protein [Pandoraea fibrosis]VVD73571.1 CHAD domain-containing protein [Pandoraea fibrosis]
MLRDMTRATTAAIAASGEVSPATASADADAIVPLDAADMRRMSAAHLLVTLASLPLRQWPSLPHEPASDARGAAFDPEAIHQLRIATRRLRALIDVFSPWLKPRWHRRLKAELRWLGHTMGPARDADVLATMTLPALRTEHPDIDWPAIDAHVATLRSDARAHAAEALASERQRALHALLLKAFGIGENGRAERQAAKALRRPSRTPGKRPRALAKHARNVLRARYISLFPDCRQLAMLDTEQLHALRVKIKKARYSAEALTPWLRKSVRLPYQDTLHAAQSLLGHLNDAVVAQRVFEDAPISAAQRDVLTGRLDTIIVNATSRAAHVVCQLPDAHTLERGMRKG